MKNRGSVQTPGTITLKTGAKISARTERISFIAAPRESMMMMMMMLRPRFTSAGSACWKRGPRGYCSLLTTPTEKKDRRNMIERADLSEEVKKKFFIFAILSQNQTRKRCIPMKYPSRRGSMKRRIRAGLYNVCLLPGRGLRGDHIHRPVGDDVIRRPSSSLALSTGRDSGYAMETGRLTRRTDSVIEGPTRS